IQSKDASDGDGDGDGDGAGDGAGAGTREITATTTSASRTDSPGASADSSAAAGDEGDRDGDGDAGPSLTITLLLTNGARHPFEISARYLRRRKMNVQGFNPFNMSVYTLKELILKEWRSGGFPSPFSFLALAPWFHPNDYDWHADSCATNGTPRRLGDTPLVPLVHPPHLVREDARR
ncbi:hypothetical protein KEM52_002245, partial [Ascosphaera acerosa]